MIPQSISFIFFLIASVLSCLVFMGGYWMQHMQPNDKFRYVAYVVAGVLAVFSVLFLNQSGFFIQVGFK